MYLRTTRYEAHFQNLSSRWQKSKLHRKKKAVFIKSPAHVRLAGPTLWIQQERRGVRDDKNEDIIPKISALFTEDNHSAGEYWLDHWKPEGTAKCSCRATRLHLEKRHGGSWPPCCFTMLDLVGFNTTVPILIKASWKRIICCFFTIKMTAWINKVIKT